MLERQEDPDLRGRPDRHPRPGEVGRGALRRLRPLRRPLPAALRRDAQGRRAHRRARAGDPALHPLPASWCSTPAEGGLGAGLPGGPDRPVARHARRCWRSTWCRASRSSTATSTPSCRRSPRITLGVSFWLRDNILLAGARPDRRRHRASSAGARTPPAARAPRPPAAEDPAGRADLPRVLAVGVLPLAVDAGGGRPAAGLRARDRVERGVQRLHRRAHRGRPSTRCGRGRRSTTPSTAPRSSPSWRST